MNGTVQKVRSSIGWSVLSMARPANILTAWADILAGYAVSGANSLNQLVLLLIATSGLYGGGIIWNDVCDADEDAHDRPERPIPRGVVSRSKAAIVGTSLLAVGTWAAYASSRTSALWALSIVLAVLFYDARGKHLPFVGPLSMGLCRGLNFMLGLSISPERVVQYWSAALIALFYVAGITALSRNEVRGGDRGASLISAMWLSCSLVSAMALLASGVSLWYYGLPFFAILIARFLPVFARAASTLRAEDVRTAIKTGVLMLVVLDAGIAASFAGPLYGLSVLVLYLPAALLSKLFAVT